MRARAFSTLTLLAPAMLAACGGATRSGNEADTASNATGNAAAPDTGYVKRVIALPPGQQRGVVLRAIQDGGGDCQTISEFKPQPIEDGRAVWAVRCDAGQRWIVSVGDDGVARSSGLPAGG